jgi:signal transduction histidine kinase
MFVVRSLFFDDMPRWYKWYAYCGIGLNFATWFLALPVLYAYSLVGIGEGLRSLALAIVKKKDGAWIIGAGFVAVGIGVVVQAIHDVSAGGVQESNAAATGVLGLLIAMCIQLARDFSRTHRQKLEQEVENARKAQALEEAKKLEQAHHELAEKHRELVETQSQLVQAEKMASLGRLVAGVAHEINTPIGAMSSAHDSMRKAKVKLEGLIAEKGNEELKSDRKLATSFKVMEDAANVIEMGSARVAGIVDRLRSFARLDEAELQRADVHRGIEDTIAMAAHELGSGIEVVRELGADVPEILCKPNQLNQVLLNLLMNAKQANARRIVVRTRRAGQRVTIEVADDGAGMSEETVARAFEPGFTTRGNRVGLGLGLSTAYRVVREHGGEISIASALGKGTTVAIALPISIPG